VVSYVKYCNKDPKFARFKSVTGRRGAKKISCGQPAWVDRRMR
jgi:hypothetical protein